MELRRKEGLLASAAQAEDDPRADASAFDAVAGVLQVLHGVFGLDQAHGEPASDEIQTTADGERDAGAAIGVAFRSEV
jgi:hypothetical protein